MAPWGVLSVGMSKITPLTIGQATQLVGLLIVFISCLLGFTPGIGTLANMFFIGLFVDLIMCWNLIPMQTEIAGQLVMLLLSVLVLGVASLFYLRVQLGAGPRDGLMLGLTKKLDKPVAYIRTSMEVTVSIIGYLMGGPVAIGTVVTALTVGYSVQFFFKLGHLSSKSEQMDLLQLYRFLKKQQKLE
jgi:uncharacterized membrane protein YczE